MRNIILILCLFILVSSKKFLAREALPEELDDEIILQKGGFHSKSINIRPVRPINQVKPINPGINNKQNKPGNQGIHNRRDLHVKVVYIRPFKLPSQGINDKSNKPDNQGTIARSGNSFGCPHSSGGESHKNNISSGLRSGSRSSRK